MNSHKDAKIRRKHRVSSKIKGVHDKPRLSVFRSCKNILVQAIDDTKNVTVASYSSLNKLDKKEKNKTQVSFEVGRLLGEELKKKRIQKAVFDRGYYKYHGRVKAVADGIRSSGVII
jgi:large subunit ribosomal protein L18